MDSTASSFSQKLLLLQPIRHCCTQLGLSYESNLLAADVAKSLQVPSYLNYLTITFNRGYFNRKWLLLSHPDKTVASEKGSIMMELYRDIFVDKEKGAKGREIITRLEKWLFDNDVEHMNELQLIQGSISFVEDIIDKIDDLNIDSLPCKDIISVSKLEYEESFPEYAEVFDTNATEYEVVKNIKFDNILPLLNNSSVTNPLIITSVRKSETSGRLTYGRQYVVESATENEIKIDYEHEGDGNLQIPEGVTTALFQLRCLLVEKKQIIECEASNILCLRHSLGGKNFPKISCLACETEKSKQENTSVSIVDAYLKTQGLKRVGVPSDGHCILHSWRLGLAEMNIIFSSGELLQCVIDEITQNLSFFKEFLPNEDLLSQLQAYVQLHNYQSAVVDLMVYGLANATLTTCVIFSESKGIINRTIIEPREGKRSTCEIHLCKVGPHYDAVLKLSSTAQEDNSEEKQDDDEFSDASKRSTTPDIQLMSAVCSDREDVIVIQSSSSDETYESYDCAGQEDANDLSDSHITLLSTSESDTHPDCSDLKKQKPVYCEELPYDIDGNVIYMLPYNSDKKMKSSLDGRPWKTWVTTSRKGFAGVWRIAHCKGSYKCCNSQCSYKKQYKGMNRTQFEKEDDEVVCKCCGLRAFYVSCPATKVWEFPRNSNLVTIVHTGYHTCIPKRRLDSSGLRKTFEDNPNLKPRQAAFNSAINALKKGESWEEVLEITDRFININKVKNVKQKVRQDMHPAGVNFEAIGQLKSRVSERDPFYIYRVNDRRLNQKTSYVFKTSKAQINIAISMDRHSDGLLCKEYCFMDIKHNRCPGFKTLSIHVYHPLLRRLVTLATMECEDETTSTLTNFWVLFNEVIQKVSGDSSKIFNPIGWMADEAGSNWSSIVRVFGQESFNRTVGCQFHFKQSVNRHANKLNSSKSKELFKTLSNDLVHATTESVYQKCLQKLKDFISEKPHKRDFLTTWLDWWHYRRFHIFKAFRAKDNTPTTNLAESVHSTWKSTRSTNITLVDAAYHDIAESIHVERQLEQFKSGGYSGGTGPSAYSRQQMNYHSQMRRAEQYAAEILDSDTDKIENCSTTTYLLDPECSHRPTKRKKKPKNQGPRKGSMTHGEISELSSSSSEDSLTPSISSQKKAKRDSRFRSQRSKTFELSLQKAKSMINDFKLVQCLDLCAEKLFTINRPPYSHERMGPTYHVKIGKNPTCTCPLAQKKNIVCKHRIWVMLFQLHLPEDSYLLQQISFTLEEVNHMFEKSGLATVKISEKSQPEKEQHQLNSDSSQRSDIFQKHQQNRQPQIWRLCRPAKKPGRSPRCAGCLVKNLPEHSLQVTVNGLYIPNNTNFCVPRIYHFCANFECLSLQPVGSNLVTPPVSVEIESSSVTSADVEEALAAGVPVL